jgi:hypothetical protein
VPTTSADSTRASSNRDVHRRILLFYYLQSKKRRSVERASVPDAQALECAHVGCPAELAACPAVALLVVGQQTERAAAAPAEARLERERTGRGATVERYPVHLQVGGLVG